MPEALYSCHDDLIFLFIFCEFSFCVYFWIYLCYVGREAQLIENSNQCSWFVELQRACICPCLLVCMQIEVFVIVLCMTVCSRMFVCAGGWWRQEDVMRCEPRHLSVRVAWPLPSDPLHRTAANERCHCMTAARPLFRTDGSSNTYTLTCTRATQNVRMKPGAFPSIRENMHVEATLATVGT